MKLHFIEPLNLKNCVSNSCVDGCSKIPLFHGTRMYALQANDEDRKRFYIALIVNRNATLSISN